MLNQSTDRNSMNQDLYNQAFQDWITYTEKHDSSLLSKLLADDVVFHSPVVFTPQLGKNITFLYLTAATQILKEFRYSQTIRDGGQWALRFEGQIGDIKVIGFDIITLNDEGKIINFEVLVRPAKAVIAIQQAMADMLEKLKN
jgi:hypothetical protein